MRRILFIIIMICFIVYLQANDSTKTKPKRFLMDISIAGASHRKSTNLKLAEYSQNTTYCISNWIEYDLGIQYCFKAFKVKNRNYSLNAGAGGGYGTFNFSESISDWNTSATDHFPSYYSYSKNYMSTKMNSGSGKLFLGFINQGKYFWFSQQIGLRYVYIGKKSITNEYDEKIYSEYMDQSPAYVTPNNPDGWHLVTSNSQEHHSDTFIFYGGINYFYKMDFGIKLGSFFPYAGLEIRYSEISVSARGSYIGPAISEGLTYNLKAGLAYKF